MTIRFTAKIIGGPHDGAIAVYEGNDNKATASEVFAKMRFMEWDNHKYRIENFDSETLTANLVW